VPLFLDERRIDVMLFPESFPHPAGLAETSLRATAI